MVTEESARKSLTGLELDLELEHELRKLSLDLEICIPLNLVKDSKVPALAKIIYGVLKSFCVGKRCNPSLIEIADRSGLALPNVPRNLRNLEQKGYIRIKKAERRNLYEFVK